MRVWNLRYSFAFATVASLVLAIPALTYTYTANAFDTENDAPQIIARIAKSPLDHNHLPAIALLETAQYAPVNREFTSSITTVQTAPWSVTLGKSCARGPPEDA